MILEELTLHNFGVYRGRYTVNLTPEPGRPVVLIGGMNGGGKTSFLDALQLALYGRLSRTSNRGDLAYDDYLMRCIHRGVPATTGAAVELQFTHTDAGKTHRYRIHRSWRAARAGVVREHVEVLRDGHPDRLLTDAWDEQVDAFLPPRLAPLFFFDGEKIESLADPQSAQGVLSTAMHGLLGLDVIRRLEQDLVILERRQRAETLADDDQVLVSAAQRSLEDSQRARAAALLCVGQARNNVGQAQLKFDTAEGAYRAAGGALFEERESLERGVENTKRELQRVEEELRRHAIGAAPLLLVQALLTEASADAARTHQAQWDARLLAELETRDSALLDALGQHRATGTVQRLIETTLREDRERRAAAAGNAAGLVLSDEERSTIEALCTEILPSANGSIRDLLAAHADAVAAVELAERRLTAVPETEQIRPLLATRDHDRKALEESRFALSAADQNHESACRAVDDAERDLTRCLAEGASSRFAREDAARIVTHSTRVRGTLQRYGTALVSRRLREIQQLVLDSFRSITRKKDLVRDINIDPETFAFGLIGQDGTPLSPERLSAGERQLLAVAILWGLAKAAARPLPAIIDTPLGRLDSVHRDHLVRCYFPFASHQVVLLSTDEEIDEVLYRALSPVVARSYLLQHDAHAGYTRVEPGYFWN